jgi:hypothetical protein
LEDRRPNSAADPYKVAGRIIKTVKSAAVELARVRRRHESGLKYYFAQLK